MHVYSFCRGRVITWATICGLFSTVGFAVEPPSLIRRIDFHEIRSLLSHHRDGVGYRIEALAVSPNGNLLAWCDDPGNAYLWHSQRDEIYLIREAKRLPPRIEDPNKPTCVDLFEEYCQQERQFPTSEQFNEYVTRRGFDANELIEEYRKMIEYDQQHPWIPSIQALRFVDDQRLYLLDARATLWMETIKEGRPVDSPMKMHDLPGLPGIFVGNTVVMQDDASFRLSDLIHGPTSELRSYHLDTGIRQGICKIYPRRSGGQEIYLFAPAANGEFLGIASALNSGLVQMKGFRLRHTLGLRSVNAMAINDKATQLAVSNNSEGIVVIDTESGHRLHHVQSSILNNLRAMVYDSEDKLWCVKFTTLGCDGDLTSTIYQVNLDTNAIEEILSLKEGVWLLYRDINRNRLYAGCDSGNLYIYLLPQ